MNKHDNITHLSNRRRQLGASRETGHARPNSLSIG
jgi:hypothetical protein